MPENHFDEPIAARYDFDAADMFDPAVIGPTVDFLAGLAGDGAALELAIGTGRVGVPLAARGVPVHGIELSEAMAARVLEKPGGDAIPITIGDMATTRVEGSFRLVYLVWNTIGNLTTQEAQVACFRNAAAHLEPGGCFVVEVWVPQLQQMPLGQTIVPFSVEEAYLGFDEYDLLGQGLVSHHFNRRPDGSWERRSLPFRYVWPSELDLMAELAGLRLRERWADWSREPFTAESPKHVSVWQKA